MGKFFGPKSHCLYLDQFAISRIIGASTHGNWSSISDVIRQGVSEGGLICPGSIEQDIEAVPLTDVRASELTRGAEILSSGWRFKTGLQIAAQQLMAQIRGREFNVNDFLDRVDRKFDESDFQESREALRKIVGLAEDNYGKFANDVNVARAITRQGRG